MTIVLTLDYFRSVHQNIIRKFIAYFEESFGCWFGAEIDHMDIDSGQAHSLKLTVDTVLENIDSLRYSLLMLNYFVSRIVPYQGMRDGKALQRLHFLIGGVRELLLQCHCIKILRSFLNISVDEQDIDMEDYNSSHLSFHL